MKTKKIMIVILAFFLLFSILTSIVNARVQYYQVREKEGNYSIQDLIGVCYTKGEQDYIKSNKFFEGYLLYDMYIQKWNLANPSYSLEYCNLTIKKDMEILYNITYTEQTPDIVRGKYFVQFENDDCFTFNFFCKYNYYSNQSKLDMPVNAFFVTPSWECKSCQFYEWSLIEGDIINAQEIGNNIVTISEYIKKLFLLNFEIWLALFWIFLILMIFVAISFIFILVYYIYLYLQGIAK